MNQINNTAKNISIEKKLYQGEKEQAINDIFERYNKKGYAIINFLYFANAMKRRLFEEPRNCKDTEYKQALLNADFLFADGIALQVYCYVIEKKRLKNLNGTDLTPHILKKLKQKYKKAHIAILSLHDESIKKDKSRLEKGIKKIEEKRGLKTQHHQQIHYSQRKKGHNLEKYKTSLEKEKHDIHILINATGTPTQELRSEKKKKRIKENNILVINAGGRIDFVSGFEKRAPKRVVKSRIGETFRRIATNPSKNIAKFWAMFGIIRLFYKKKTKNNSTKTT